MGKVKTKKSSLLKRNIKKFKSNKLAMSGLIAIVIFLIITIFAPLFTDYDPVLVKLGDKNMMPGLEHIMGTDKLGRDVFSRILYGGRMSILISVTASLIGSGLGVVFGCIGGYFGGKIDSLLVKISEIFQTFPSMILILILVTFMGQSVLNLILIFGITGWMTPFRLVRGEFLTLREETYVEVCRAFGISKISIMFRHILPNAISPIVIAFTINIAGYILSEAGLSYIGLGVPSSIPTWGNILNAAKSLDVITNYWWLWLFPGIAISLFVLAVNFLGDGLRDVIDPNN